MTDANELLHRRFRDLRPGMQLVAIEDAAVPVTILSVDVLAQERKEIPLLEEFALRLMLGGMTNCADMAAFLGLEGDQVELAVANQIVADNIVEARGSLRLTTKGKEIGRDHAAVVPKEAALRVVFDRSLWGVVDYPQSQMVRLKDAKDAGWLLLPAQATSSITDLDVTALRLNTLLNSGGNASLSSIQVLDVRNVKREKHLYMPAKLLVYWSEVANDVQLALAIDNDLSISHDEVLQGAASDLGISVEAPAPRPKLEAELEAIRSDVSQEDPADSESIESESSPSPAGVVRSVSVFEHPALLQGALQQSQHRLLIIAPWVKRTVVTTQFLELLERRLLSGVQVHIAHGYKSTDVGSDADALRHLSNMRDRFHERFTLARLRSTHAKILISDDSWVTTSFNWLSFRGAEDLTYRMEEGTLVTIPSVVDAEYKKLLQMIQDQRRATRQS